MSGVYLHIPFCRKACHYCNFHFSTSTQYIPNFVEAICNEIQAKPIPSTIDLNIDTIYFGGGTPSILTLRQLEKILAELSTVYNWDKGTEATIEVNPEDVNAEYLQGLYDLGFNRLSIGIQSFEKADLQLMNRNHSAEQSHQALKLIASSQISNYNIDLMFGLIDRSIDDWKNNLQTTIKYNPPHISCYNLTIEEQTAFKHFLKTKKIKESSEVDQLEQFRWTHRFLENQGYDHYEISNYALSGEQAVHNSNYWQRIPYISYGPSAHSFDGYNRFWNPSNNQRYLKQIENRNLQIEYEVLNEFSAFNEYIMLGLRTQGGLSKSDIIRFSSALQRHWEKASKRFIQEGILIERDDHFTLHFDWWYTSDDIAAQLFIADQCQKDEKLPFYSGLG